MWYYKVRFKGSNPKLYTFKSNLDLKKDVWYSIVAKGGYNQTMTTYTNPIMVQEKVSLYDVDMDTLHFAYKEITNAFVVNDDNIKINDNDLKNTNKINNIFEDIAKYCEKFLTSNTYNIALTINHQNPVNELIGMIENVYFNELKGTTVIVWKDGVRTKVTCGPDDFFDQEKGLAMCVIKRLCGNKGNYNNFFKKWCPDLDIF